jgi:hypothetical protein
MLPLLWRFFLLRLSPDELEMVKRRAGHSVGVISGCADGTCLTPARWFWWKAAAGAAAPCVDGSVVGRETILGYPTTAVERSVSNPRATQERPAARMTLWMAPDLGCFALRIRTEEQGPDGTFHLVSGKQALKVTLHP